MKHFKHYVIIAALALIISACGGAATPSIDPVSVQNTAVAAAFTMVAQTQAAIPTATALPPTDTPVPTAIPTDTLAPVPTLDTASTQLSLPTLAPTTVSASDNSCNGIVSKTITGKPTRIRIVNETKHAGVKVWLYLNLTAFGECGYYPIYSALAKNGGDYFLDAVQGQYNIGAWTDDGKLNVGGSGGINNPDKWTFHIRDNNIILTPP